MDCLKAQQVLSDALDRAPVDRLELAESKEHCRSCADCGGFVRAMLAVRRTPLPAPPSDLADRIVAEVREEAQRTAVARARAVAARADVPPIAKEPFAAPEPERAARSVGDLITLAASPRYRRSVALWAGAAAIVFIFAGWAAIAGVRTILIPPDAGSARLATKSADNLGATSLAPPTTESNVTSQGAVAGNPADLAYSTPQFIVVNGTVYRFQGLSPDAQTASLPKLGETRSSLDTSQLPSRRDVLGAPGSATAYIVDGARVLAFTRVSRSYEGRAYLLRSAAIDSFGTWPSMPSGVARPQSPNGAPGYTEAGKGADGVVVYRKSTGDTAEGIAIGPDAPASDPIAGCPDWTWWAPETAAP